MAFLAVPSETYRDSFIEAVREFQAEARYTDLDIATLARLFAEFVRLQQEKRTKPPLGRVPETIYWLIDEGEYIGQVTLRHELTHALLNIGGHIGYEIRPSKRRQGYGTAGLRLMLAEAHSLGMTRVLVTCDDDNIASAKIIEANGGVLEDVRKLAGHRQPVRRYWITLAAG